jgi:hypothetical protein
MMGFDPRKWLSGLGPQARPDARSFVQYGAGNVIPPPDAQRFGPVGASAGKPTVQYTQKFDASGHARAKEDWAFDEDIRQRKMAKFAELMEYGQKDLNPRPPSHNFVGESGGVEVSWPDMIGEQAYLDLDQPIDRLTSYEDEAERRRRALLARYLA